MFQLSVQVIHHTKPGVNSPPLSSDKVLKVSHCFTFTSEVNKYLRKNVKISEKKPKQLLSWHTFRQEGKDEENTFIFIYFLPSHTSASAGASAKIIPQLRVAALLPELTLLLSAPQ